MVIFKLRSCVVDLAFRHLCFFDATDSKQTTLVKYALLPSRKRLFLRIQRYLHFWCNRDWHWLFCVAFCTRFELAFNMRFCYFIYSCLGNKYAGYSHF